MISVVWRQVEALPERYVSHARARARVNAYLWKTLHLPPQPSQVGLRRLFRGVLADAQPDILVSIPHFLEGEAEPAFHLLAEGFGVARRLPRPLRPIAP